jgi:hypothetical protein
LLDRLSQTKKLDEFIQKWFHDKAKGTLVAAFHAFEAPSDFENSLGHHLRRLIDRRIVRIRGFMSATQSIAQGRNRANHGRTRLLEVVRDGVAVRASGTGTFVECSGSNRTSMGRCE